ncbi:DUF2007 domain-containing protein [Zunongwangia endophytica]|uniref:DUF2007 domain-containing protein n=1 Tax=Zunongwangia endophytica TaxID=1808945 RepID=A0ABV8H5X3_9FLAO|nr:DUF2007 domain-containing protein [Zunongwangia endophytica]MDN3595925.1 DUF2007 domain-containing protein [Zunongwangia endophytica]
MKDYIYLQSYTYTFECHVVKHLLDNENILYHFKNETLIDLIPLSSFAFGGIKLYIHKSQLTKAKKLLDQIFKTNSHLRIV